MIERRRPQRRFFPRSASAPSPPRPAPPPVPPNGLAELSDGQKTNPSPAAATFPANRPLRVRRKRRQKRSGFFLFFYHSSSPTVYRYPIHDFHSFSFFLVLFFSFDLQDVKAFYARRPNSRVHSVGLFFSTRQNPELFFFTPSDHRRRGRSDRDISRVTFTGPPNTVVSSP